MQDLRIILIILGAVAIAALLIHGLWTSQKGRQKPMREKPLSKVAPTPLDKTDETTDGFDSDGIGRVRVAGHHQAESLSRNQELEDDWQISPHFYAVEDDEQHEPHLGLPPTLSSSVFAEDDLASAPFQEEQALADVANTPAASQPEKAAESDSPVLAQPESEAELRARQYQKGEIDPLFDNHEPAPAELPPSPEPIAEANVQPEAPVSPTPEPVIAKPAPKTWQEVYVINVMAKPEQLLAGTELVRAVTDAGFVFGDMDIFHRYQGSAGQGEPLFSLANMVNPGTFNPNAMSEFTTPGVSIFMQLPPPGMAKNHFNMMIQAADNIAEDLDALLVDNQRQALALEYLVRCRGQLSDYDSQAQ
ncbi:cell division protein ZipA [Oceanisphaera avium]|uniref:Cell division protein ZipA n=1 Tax=Oceanisphaera avium TaxID=1903694 RepID=A0A1Y0CYD7_9GAMM|nr:cell division protein ZipA [Oceanisphaera avium]ART79917.1 cell division protein ZipA [Oceanisphaera avium]